MAELEDLSSPIGAFIRDKCRTGPELQIKCTDLFAMWRSWCEEQGRDHPGSAPTFGRDLRAAVPGLKVTQPWELGSRVRIYEGIGYQ